MTATQSTPATPEAARHIVVAEDLTREYIKGRNTIRAIDGINLQVSRGEFVAINGPSGSGKTTLLFAVAGLIRATRGYVEVAGVNVSDRSPTATAHFRANNIGFIFQTFYLVPYLTALENVRLAQRAAGSGGAAEASELLGRIGLAERLTHYPNELSAGEQQRVALARALINRPGLLLGDEPTGNLDTARGREILELIADYNRRGGTVILVSHSDAVSEFATRRVNLVDGKLAEGVNPLPLGEGVPAGRARGHFQRRGGVGLDFGWHAHAAFAWACVGQREAPLQNGPSPRPSPRGRAHIFE